ncbi:MAG: polysaccharide deacetylase family protein [Verrucomicrobiae bacterium]|nr:polysaccharide deacetylase family protein [Verrucomicrobiae bacterium]
MSRNLPLPLFLMLLLLGACHRTAPVPPALPPQPPTPQTVSNAIPQTAVILTNLLLAPTNFHHHSLSNATFVPASDKPSTVPVILGSSKTNLTLYPYYLLSTNWVAVTNAVPATNSPVVPPPEIPVTNTPPIAPTNTVSETGLSKKPTITILCYHQFDRPGNPYSVSSEEFRRHLQTFRDRGYTVIPLSRALDFWQGKTPALPEKSLVITIDDGFRSVHQKAYPLLKEFNYPWVFYIYTDFVDSGAGAVTWDHLREMMRDGMEIGCHSKSHSLMTKRGKRGDEEYEKWLVEETLTPKKILEEKLGVPIRSFAYPYGGYNALVRKFTEAAGYEAITTVSGANNYSGSDPRDLNRFVITRDFPLEKALSLSEKNEGLLLSELTPALSTLADSNRPVISARLSPEQDIDPKTLVVTVSKVGAIPPKFDPQTRLVSVQPPKELPFGPCYVTIRAREKSGGKMLEGTWFFQVGSPETQGLKLPPGGGDNVPPHAPHPDTR